MNGYRLSPVQRLAWSSGQPMLTAELQSTEPLDLARLQQAWSTVLDRHEALRLTLVRHPGLRVPLQDVDDNRDHSIGAQGEINLTVTGDCLTLAMSPLFADPASLRLALIDLAAAYAGHRLSDDPERLQFLDVCEWQHEARAEAEAEAAPEAERPVASVAAVLLDAARETFQASLPAAELNRAAADLDVPTPTLLLTAWLIALTRYCESEPGATDSVIRLGLWTDGRQAPGTEGVIGPLGGYVPAEIPVPLPAALTAAVALARSIEQATDQRFHLREPVAAQAQVAGGFAARPGTDLSALSGLAATAVRLSAPPALDAPTLTAEYDATSIRLSMTGTQLLFDGLLAVLNGLPAAVAGEALLRPWGLAEQAWLITASGAGPGFEDSTLTELLDAGIRAANADDLAVTAEDGELDFAGLDAAATAVAAALERGVLPGARVGVLAHRKTTTVAAMLGVLRAGAVYVPLDPGNPPARLEILLRAAEVEFVLGDEVPAGFPGACVSEILAGAQQSMSTQAASASAARTVISKPDDAAYVIFTSGSTGTPRPVLVSQRSAAHLVRALEAAVYQSAPAVRRVSVNAPLTFDASIKQLVQLAHGRTLCLIPESVRLDGGEFAQQLDAFGVQVLDITPSHLRILLAGPQVRLPDLLLIGGEPIPADLWQLLADLPGVRAVNVYGPTECTVDSTCTVIGPATVPGIGRPLPGTQVWVLDENLRPVPPQVSGELAIAGPQVALGYLGDTEATERRFVELSLPGMPRQRVYRTGDLVRFDGDSNLRYLGRIDNQIKIRGHRIEPGEIETVLRAHPAVRDAVVTARDDDGRGKRLVGYVQSSVAAAMDISGMRGVNPHETRYLYDEIFSQQVYLQHGLTLRQGAVVFDVGANIGMFSLFVAAVCPDATIHAFEPIPQVCQALNANVSAYRIPATVHEYGLSTEEADVEFTYYPGYSVMSGQAAYADPDAEVAVIKRYLSNEVAQGDSDGAALLERADELLADRFSASAVQASLRPLADVIAEIDPPRIDLLKIDVQRAEAAVLAGIAEHQWPLIDQIAMEVHDGIGTETEGRVDDIAALLERHGFEVTITQDDLLVGTDRYMMHALRPAYARDPRPAAAVAPASTTAELTAELREWLAGRLPAHLVPDVLMLVENFPMTSNGKLDREALPAPGGAGPASSDVIAPRDEAEEILLGAWREVLGSQDIGVTDNFFAIGGDSIRSIQVQASAARAGLTFRLRDIFAHQSIRELVEQGEVNLAGRQGGDQPAVETAPAGLAFRSVSELDRPRLPAGLLDAYPMTALQQGMVYHCEVSGDPAMYHNVTAHLISTGLDEAALWAALAGLIAEHPILRTAFALGAFSEPLQLIHDSIDFELPVHDLSELSGEDQRQQIDELIEAERRRPFDWARPPLVRLQAAVRDADSFYLLVAEHHAILDGWSLHLLLHELLLRYDGHRSQLVIPPTAPSLGFSRFVELERDTQADPVVRRAWADRLAGMTPLLLSSPAPRINRIHRVALPPETLARLEQAAGDTGVPLKSYLLGVHLRALAELTGRCEVVTGLVFSGRPEEEGADRTLGLFLNTLPLNVMTGGSSLADIAEQAWRQEQDLIGYHRFPLAEITRMAGGRLFDSFFNFTRFHDLPQQSRTHIVDSRGIAVDVAFALAADVEVSADGSRLELNLHYDARRFDEDWITALAGVYRRLMNEDPRPPLPPTAQVDSQLPNAIDEDGWTAAVAGLWREIIGTAPRAADSDFFAAGGDSLRALRMVACLRDRHGSKLTLAEFTDLRTLGALAERVGADA